MQVRFKVWGWSSKSVGDVKRVGGFENGFEMWGGVWL